MRVDLVVIIAIPTQKTAPRITAEITRAGTARAQKLLMHTPYIINTDNDTVIRHKNMALIFELSFFFHNFRHWRYHLYSQYYPSDPEAGAEYKNSHCGDRY